MAEEYLHVCYKLWETSWDDDAVQADRQTGVYADPRKVHGIDHQGTPGHLVQGAGLSFERTLAATLAGDLPGGRAFAAANAECVFVAAPSKAVLRKQLAELRAAVLDRDEYGDRAQLPTTASSGVLLHAKA